MRRLRAPWPRFVLAATVVGFLAAAPAFPSGFQVMTQGAKATGMGLAFTGIADDPSAIFYNPAGIGFQDHFSIMVGAAVLSRASTDFTGANPYPGIGATGSVQKQVFGLPNVYIVVPLTNELKFGVGIDEPYGLGVRWNNPETWSGRFISQNAIIKSADINPVFSYKLFPELSISAGAVYRFSGVQLERNTAATDPFTQAQVDVAHTKLYSGLGDNGAWGYNAAILWKPVPSVGIGASYRSKITVDYTGTATVTARPTGDPVFDQLVAASGIFGVHPVKTQVAFPASLNIGAGINFGGGWTVGLEADWTEWSSFQALNITFPDGSLPNIDRSTAWNDSWAYRIGIEKNFGGWAVRAGYYFDNTPQPEKDAGPILADNDRDVFTAGFGYNTPQWGFDIGGAYIVLKDRQVLTQSTDNFFGTYSEKAWAAVADIRFSF
ncbi:MAG TPA: outer membrane protein transport protein [Thermoanaerobaculia bacterium]|nr:outer membrane protein transport protein [Thermoanaerobaculia bacterium]